MKIHHSHNPGRVRARLISTPTTGGHSAMSTTIAGVKFSDQLAALLDHAQAHGFRIEPDTKRGGKGGVLVYAPDKDIAPFGVSELRAKFNPSHYDNIRRQIYRAGCPPLPGDEKTANVNGPGVILANSRDEALAQAPEGATVVELPGGIGMVDDDGGDLIAILRDEDAGPDFMAQVVSGLMDKAGAGKAEAALVAIMTKTAASWVAAFSGDRIALATEQVKIDVEQRLQKEVNEALAIAADWEATATRMGKALERAEASEKKARQDCGAAIARAEAAEAKARELEAAIAPLRAVLKQG